MLVLYTILWYTIQNIGFHAVNKKQAFLYVKPKGNEK